MTITLPIHAKTFGAKGDDAADDTSKLQAALNVANGQREVYVPAGIYRVQAAPVTTGGLQMNIAGSHLRLHKNAVLKVIPNNSTHYQIIRVSAADCIIEGGTLLGDVGTHTDTGGEWGYGVWVDAGAHRCQLRDLTATLCWGDGILLFGSSLDDVEISRVRCTDNRRNGCSVIYANRARVINCTFDYNGTTAYTGPGAGIDWEPDDGRYVLNGYMSGCVTHHNQGPGIAVGGLPTSSTELRVDGHLSDHDQILAGSIGECAILIAPNSKVELNGLTVRSPSSDGVRVDDSTAKVTMTDVRIESAGRRGYILVGAATMLGCSTKDSGAAGIYIDGAADGSLLRDCVVEGAGTSTTSQGIDNYGDNTTMIDCVVKSPGASEAYSYVVRTGALGAVLSGCMSLAAGTDGHYVDQTAVAKAFPVPGVALKPTITGSRGANAALASLLTALANLGLIIDSSS